MGNATDNSGELRVILVGVTGLDGSLRAEPGMELIRARTPVDALGELADPLDPERPGRAVVIVGPGAEPPAGGAGDLTEFLAGLRRVDPAVHVLRVSRNGEAMPEGYDGQLGPAAGPEELRRFLADGRETPPPVATETVEPKPARPAEEPEVRSRDRRSAALTNPTATNSATPGGELELLQSINSGSPVGPLALEKIRRMPGFTGVAFVEAGESGVGGAHSSAPVVCKGELAGWLRSDSLPPRALEPAAEWLGAWLELEREQARLRELAFRDPLTGAWNRRYFDDFLPRAIEEARAKRRSLTLLLFDIDNFKRFNDQHGHAAGDEILTECVRLLYSAVRPTDKVCRIGGDEFAVIFYEPQGPRQPDSQHPTSVFDITERFRLLVCEARFRKLADDAPGHLTISGGLATYPWDGATVEALIERADQLALDGKRQGKNVIAIGPGCRRIGER